MSRDRFLDNVSIHWLTASGASSARLYGENSASGDLPAVTAPTAVSSFPAGMMTLPRAWVETRCTGRYYWNELPAGGHFASLEVPEAFVAELQAAFG